MNTWEGLPLFLRTDLRPRDYFAAGRFSFLPVPVLYLVVMILLLDT